VHRDWSKRERCSRCKSLGLPCGPNITANEQRERAGLSRRDADDKGKHEAYPAPFQSPRQAFSEFESASSYGIFSDGEDATSGLNWSPPPTFEPNPTQSHDSMSKGPLRTGSHKIPHGGQEASRNLMDWSPTTSFGEDGAQFDSYPSEELSTGLEGGFKETESKERYLLLYCCLSSQLTYY
jgi:hypothetical protein